MSTNNSELSLLCWLFERQLDSACLNQKEKYHDAPINSHLKNPVHHSHDYYYGYFVKRSDDITR